MKVMAISRFAPGATLAQLGPYQAAEERRVWELYSQGVFRELYLDVAAPTAVVLMEAPDVASAQAALATLPYVQAGILQFDCRGLGPYLSLAAIFQPA